MKKLYMLLLTIIVISACGKNEGDDSVCTCKNNDNVVVGTYTGLSESDCMERETTGVTCVLN